MKLKKIASLALAGVMAVSMLAGCAGKTDNTNTEVSTSASDIVKAVNDGQSASNKVKVTFTADSKLDTALERAVAEYGKKDGTNVAAEIETAITNMTGLKSNPVTNLGSISNEQDGLVLPAAYYDNLKSYLKDIDGKTFTYYDVFALSGFSSVEAVESYFADQVDAKVAKLGANSNLDKSKAGDKYYGYSYDGNVSMVSVKNADGTTTYYVAVVANQHVAEKTL